MKKKIIVFLTCVVLITTTIPLTNAKYVNKSDFKTYSTDETNDGEYFFCYVESSGTPDLQLSFFFRKLLNHLDVLLFLITHSSDGLTTIYNRENGNVLFQHQGSHQLNLISYHGYFEYVDNPDGSTSIIIRGSALFAKTIIK